MNLRSCHYFSDKESLIKFFSEQPDVYNEYSNKMRCCILLNSENNLSVEKFNSNTVVKVHELLTQFLTYEPNAKKTFQHPAIPVVDEKTYDLWVQDIDVWIGLPSGLQVLAKRWSPHIFCYDNLEPLEL